MQDNSYLLLRAVGGRLWQPRISKWMWQKILICRDSLVLLEGFKKQNTLCVKGSHFPNVLQQLFKVLLGHL